MHKILLLPTYFPTKKAPIVGSQILEQSEMMLEFFDIRAIYCIPGMGWKRFIFTKIFGKLLKNKGYPSCDQVLLSDKIVAKGVYYFQSKKLPVGINQSIKNNAYNFVLNRYFESGWKPTLIHSRGFAFGGLTAGYLKSKHNIPVIHTENTALLFDTAFNQETINNYRKVLTKADSLLFVSNFLLRNTLMHGFVKKRNYHVVGNSVDENAFKLTQNINNTGNFRILFTGYNSYIKDIPTFFKAIKEMVNNGYSSIKIKFAMTYGSEKSRSELIELAKSHGIFQFCEFLLAVPRNEMPNLINSCDVLVSTSLVETFGIGALEAMFCGVPVIATRNGGMEDFICDDNGILCDIGDSEALSKAISSIIKKDKEFCSEKIRNSVVNKYGKEAFKMRLKELYDETIQSSTIK